MQINILNLARAEIICHDRPNKPTEEQLISYRNHLRFLTLIGLECTELIDRATTRHQQNSVRFTGPANFRLPDDHHFRTMPWLDELTFYAGSAILGVADYFLYYHNAAGNPDQLKYIRLYTIDEMLNLIESFQKALACKMFSKSQFRTALDHNDGYPCPYLVIHAFLPALITAIQALIRSTFDRFLHQYDAQIGHMPNDIVNMIADYAALPKAFQNWPVDVDACMAKLARLLRGSAVQTAHLPSPTPPLSEL